MSYKFRFSGFQVSIFGLWVWSLNFGVWGFNVWVWGLEILTKSGWSAGSNFSRGLGFRVWGLGFRVWGLTILVGRGLGFHFLGFGVSLGV